MPKPAVTAQTQREQAAHFANMNHETYVLATRGDESRIYCMSLSLAHWMADALKLDFTIVRIVNPEC